MAAERDLNGERPYEPSGIPEARRNIDAVIRENVSSISRRFERPAGLDESEIVLGWFLVVETMSAAELDGEQTQAWGLHTISADTTAERDLTPWTAKGYLHQVLDDPANYLMDYDHFNDD